MGEHVTTGLLLFLFVVGFLMIIPIVSGLAFSKDEKKTAHFDIADPPLQFKSYYRVLGSILRLIAFGGGGVLFLMLSGNFFLERLLAGEVTNTIAPGASGIGIIAILALVFVASVLIVASIPGRVTNILFHTRLFTGRYPAVEIDIEGIQFKKWPKIAWGDLAKVVFVQIVAGRGGGQQFLCLIFKDSKFAGHRLDVWPTLLFLPQIRKSLGIGADINLAYFQLNDLDEPDLTWICAEKLWCKATEQVYHPQTPLGKIWSRDSKT